MMGIVISSAALLLAIAGYYYVMLKGEVAKDAFLNANDVGMSKELTKSLETVNEEGLSQATAVIQTTRGKMKFKFYTKDAPKTTHRIAELIQKGFYNGLTFHRVVPGFVIQGGDPTGSGMGGSGVNIPAEFNARKHVPGTLAMARAQDPNSADSQFYICLGTHPQLDGQYTVFGQLIEGQSVAEQVQVGDRMTNVTIDLH
jgi:cyclophilin family peptidyl-prolyl cis-trans isomerase